MIAKRNLRSLPSPACAQAPVLRRSGFKLWSRRGWPELSSAACRLRRSCALQSHRASASLLKKKSSGGRRGRGCVATRSAGTGQQPAQWRRCRRRCPVSESAWSARAGVKLWHLDKSYKKLLLEVCLFLNISASDGISTEA